jgi:hypothetical protein
VWEFLYEGEHAKKIKHRDSQNREQRFYEVNGKKYADSMRLSEVTNQLISMYTKYGAKAKAAEKNEGIDWKAMSHALRAAYQIRDIYLKGDYTYPLAETEYLRDVKAGKLDFKLDVEPALSDIVDEVELLSDSLDLPEDVNRDFWDGFLIGTYESNFGIKVLRL